MGDGTKGIAIDLFAVFQQSLICDPNNAKAYYNLGAAYGKKGLLNDAISEYRHAIAMNPYYAEAYHKLGLAFKAQGKPKEAIDAYREVIRLEPHNHEVCNELAWIYATSPQEAIRNGAEAVALATRACELTGFNKSEALDTLAAAYAQLGAFDKAVEYQLRAIEVAPPQIEKDLRKRLQLYKGKRAYRQGQ